MAPSKCKVIKWGTSSFGAAIMLRNPMQERGREMGVGFKKKKKKCREADGREREREGERGRERENGQMTRMGRKLRKDISGSLR